MNNDVLKLSVKILRSTLSSLIETKEEEPFTPMAWERIQSLSFTLQIIEKLTDVEAEIKNG